MDRDLFWLTDVQFGRIEKRRVHRGVIREHRSGGCWMDARAADGPRKTLRNS